MHQSNHVTLINALQKNACFICQRSNTHKAISANLVRGYSHICSNKTLVLNTS